MIPNLLFIELKNIFFPTRFALFLHSIHTCLPKYSLLLNCTSITVAKLLNQVIIFQKIMVKSLLSSQPIGWVFLKQRFQKIQGKFIQSLIHRLTEVYHPLAVFPEHFFRVITREYRFFQ